MKERKFLKSSRIFPSHFISLLVFGMLISGRVHAFTTLNGLYHHNHHFGRIDKPKGGFQNTNYVGGKIIHHKWSIESYLKDIFPGQNEENDPFDSCFSSKKIHSKNDRFQFRLMSKKNKKETDEKSSKKGFARRLFSKNNKPKASGTEEKNITKPLEIVENALSQSDELNSTSVDLDLSQNNSLDKSHSEEDDFASKNETDVEMDVDEIITGYSMASDKNISVETVNDSEISDEDIIPKNSEVDEDRNSSSSESSAKIPRKLKRNNSLSAAEKKQISTKTNNNDKLEIDTKSKKSTTSWRKRVYGFFRFVTLAVMVIVIAPFMRITEDEYGDITGVRFVPPSQRSLPSGLPGLGALEKRLRSADNDEMLTIPDENSDDTIEKESIAHKPSEGDSNPVTKSQQSTSPFDVEKAIIGALPQVGKQSEPSTNNHHYRTNAMGYVADAVQKIGPAVIRIDTETDIERAVHARERMNDPNKNLSEEDEDEDIEGGMLDSIPDRLKFIQQGQGSGIIFSRDGLVLTNAHVIDGATRVIVTLTDGRKFPAEVRGVDEIVDIAVLKILPSDNGAPSSSSTWVHQSPLPFGELGDSDELQVGQFVIAVGSPGGLDNTVTMGIISGLKRSSEVVGLMHKKVDFIQTDAAINPGKESDMFDNILCTHNESYYRYISKNTFKILFLSFSSIQTI